MLILDGKIVDSNCMDDEFDFWTLLGYAFMNRFIKPEVQSQRHRQPVDVWVRGSKRGVDIAYKEVDLYDQAYEDHFFHRKEKKGIV